MDKKQSSQGILGSIIVVVSIISFICTILGVDGVFGVITFLITFCEFFALIISFILALLRDKNDDTYIKFLDKCHEQNIHKFKTEKEIQKGKLIAESLKLDSSNLPKLYEKACKISNKRKQEQKKSDLGKQQLEETNLQVSCTKFAGLHGRTKRIAMLTEARRLAKKQAEDARMATRMLRDMVTQSESNWAFAGGLVSGVAGPVAGALTAIDTEAKNIKIRKQNQENLNAVAPMLYSFSGNAAAHEAQAESIEKMIEDTKTKLISKDTAEDCLKKLKFSNVNISVTETGTCIVKAKASAPKNLTIFGNTKAVVDGEITASIYDKDKKLGTATMVLPIMGIPGRSSVDLVGVCLFCGGNTKDKTYDIKFSSNNLWLMEE